MSSRDQIQAWKDLQLLHPALAQILSRELKSGNAIVAVTRANDVIVTLSKPFEKRYFIDGTMWQEERGTHFSGESYLIAGQEIAAPVRKTN